MISRRANSIRLTIVFQLIYFLVAAIAVQTNLAARAVAAQTITIGKAKYRTDIPADSTGEARRFVDSQPSVSSHFRGSIPTGDWCSSLVWPRENKYSSPMFAHPLVVQARQSGLGLGYNPVASITNSEKDGKVFQTTTHFRYGFLESMVVGLDGLNSGDCVLDRHSDWTVTALWRDLRNPKNKLRATFGHGLPFVYFEREGKQSAKIQFRARRRNLDGSLKAKVYYRDKNVLGVTVNATHYGLFAPSGSRWLPSDESLTDIRSDLAWIFHPDIWTCIAREPQGR